MKNKILAILVVLIAAISTAYPALAITDGNNPASYTVNYNIQTVTTFLVQTKTATLDFNVARGTTVDPSSGNPWGNVTNQGSIPQTFKASIDMAIPNVNLWISNQSAMTTKITVGTVPAAMPGGSNVPALGSPPFDIYAKANATNAATDGLYSQSLIIQSN